MYVCVCAVLHQAIVFKRVNLIFRDLPLDRLLKLSKSFKTDVERHLNTVKVIEKQYFASSVRRFVTSQK